MPKKPDKTKSGKTMLGPTLQLFELVPITGGVLSVLPALQNIFAIL